MVARRDNPPDDIRKEGSLMPVHLILVLLLSLSGCKEESPPPRPKDQAAQLEAARRERAAIRQSEDLRQHFQTLRVIGFIILAGGAVTLLVWTEIRENRSRHIGSGYQTSRPLDRTPQGSGVRVIQTAEPPPPRNRRQR